MRQRHMRVRRRILNDQVPRAGIPGNARQQEPETDRRLQHTCEKHRGCPNQNAGRGRTAPIVASVRRSASRGSTGGMPMYMYTDVRLHKQCAAPHRRATAGPLKDEPQLLRQRAAPHIRAMAERLRPIEAIGRNAKNRNERVNRQAERSENGAGGWQRTWGRGPAGGPGI